VALVSTIIIYQSLLLEQTEHKLHGAQKQAEEKGQIAEKERLQLSSLDRAQGAHELEEGDDFAALHWLIEALRWDVEHPDEERLDRIAIALTLQHCPQFVQSVSFDGMVAGVQMSDTACWVATVGKDNAIKVREVRTGRLRELQGAVQANDPVPKIAISPDGRFLALAPEAGGRDAVTNVWDLTTGRRHTPALHHGTTALRLVFSDDNDLLTMHLADGTVLVWELRTGKRLPSGASERVAVGHRAMSDNGRWLFTLSADGVERVHDLTRGKLAALPRKLDHTVVCAALSADGRRLAFSDTSDEVRIWDIESGAARLLRPSARGGALIRQIHWNADSRLLLTVDHLNRGRVWNAVTGTPVTPPLAHPGPVLSAGFSTDGMVLTIGSDGVVQVWRLPRTRAETLGIAIKILRGEVLDTREFTSDARPMRDLMVLAETLSGRRMGARGALESVGGEQLRAIRKSLSNGDLPK
jgi:WD40 repeat protein